MHSRDRVLATFHGEPVDRFPRVEYYWAETLKKWRSQGLPTVDRDEVQYLLGHDLIYFFFDPRFGFEEKVLDEDEEYRVVYTVDGVTLRVPKDCENTIVKSDVAGIPVDYTIKGRREWEAHKDSYSSGEWRLYKQFPISGNWLGGNRSIDDYAGKYDRACRNDKFKCLVFREPYEAVREFVGTDRMLLLMAEDPALVKEMFAHNLRITLEMIDILEALGMRMDGYWVWGDIAYNKGMFFSPDMYRDLLMPVHRQLFDRLNQYVIYHTDGNLDTCLPLLVEAGIKGINPIEIKAGNDFFGLADSFGDRIVLCGGIDVVVLSTNDMERIHEEVWTKLTYMRGKRYILHSDHSIPYDVDLRTYRKVIEWSEQYGSKS